MYTPAYYYTMIYFSMDANKERLSILMKNVFPVI